MKLDFQSLYSSDAAGMGSNLDTTWRHYFRPYKLVVAIDARDVSALESNARY